MGRYLSTKQVMGDSNHKNKFQGFFGPIHIFVHVIVARGDESHIQSLFGKCCTPWALLAVQTCRHSSHSSITAGVWGSTPAPGCPHPQLHWDIEPPCHFPRLSFWTGYSGSCCRSFPFPHAFTDTSRAANLNYCPLPPTQ